MMKLVTEYEVEGCWTTQTSQRKCRACGTLLELVPDSFNHYNAKFWKLKQNDDLDLYCCPKGCSEEKASRIMREWLDYYRRYCKTGGESYAYELDYESFNNAWIDSKGKLYPLDYEGHNSFASDFGLSEIQLERKGWAKISSYRNYMMTNLNGKGINQKQLDTVFDYCIAKDYNIVGLEKGITMFDFEERT